MSRSDAYAIVQSAARNVWGGDGDLYTHLANDARVTERVDAETLKTLFDPAYHLRGIDVTFARLGLGT